jgi:hypothetical protein
MSSEVEICNAALINLGEATIISLTETDSKAARLCNQRYAAIRDAELRKLQWNFAIRRVELALLTTVPVYEFSAEFELPSDLLRFISTDDDRYEHRIEDGKLLCNRSAVKIKYVRQVTDPNEFDSLFKDSLAARIAYALAIPLTDDKGLKEEMWQMYEDTILEAQASDAFE